MRDNEKERGKRDKEEKERDSNSGCVGEPVDWVRLTHFTGCSIRLPKQVDSTWDLRALLLLCVVAT